MTDPTLAFDSTKCGLPSIPQIPEVSLQNCIVPPPNLPPINTNGPLAITPVIPSIPPTNTLSSDFLKLGIAQQAIPVGGSGPVVIYNCDVATTTTVTVYARINPIKAGDWVYWVVFPNNNDAISSACDFTPRICTLDTALNPATSITTPTTATGTGYTYQGGTLVSIGTITILNYESSLTGVVGDTVLALPLSCTGLSCLVAIAADKVAPQSQWGISNVQGGTAQSSGSCAPCVGRNLLVLNNNTVPDMFIIAGIPQILGGDANGLVHAHAINNTTWVSDSFMLACGSGADRFYWLFSIGSSCSGGAAISLIHQLGTNCSSLFPNQTTTLYYNLEDFQIRCGSYMYLVEDVCLPNVIRTNLPCRVCVYASSGLQQPTTPIINPNPSGGGPSPGPTTSNPTYPCNFNSGTGNSSLDCIGSTLYPYGGRTSNTLPNYLTLEFTGFDYSFLAGHPGISPTLLTTITNNIVNTQFQLRLTQQPNTTYTWDAIGNTDFFTMSGITYALIIRVSCITFHSPVGYVCYMSGSITTNPRNLQYAIADDVFSNGTAASSEIFMNVTNPNSWTGYAETFLIKMGNVLGGERATAHFILHE